MKTASQRYDGTVPITVQPACTPAKISEQGYALIATASTGTKKRKISGAEAIAVCGVSLGELRFQTDVLLKTLPYQTPFDRAAAALYVCIVSGINSEHSLVGAVVAITGISGSLVGAALRKRSGNDPTRHWWWKDGRVGYRLLVTAEA